MVTSCPFPGFLGRVERGWHLETVAPRRGAANPPLAPDKCGQNVGWGLRAAALREGRPHTPAVWWVRVRWLWFCAELFLQCVGFSRFNGRPPVGAPDRVIAGFGRVELAIEGW